MLQRLYLGTGAGQSREVTPHESVLHYVGNYARRYMLLRVVLTQIVSGEMHIPIVIDRALVHYEGPTGTDKVLHYIAFCLGVLG